MSRLYPVASTNGRNLVIRGTNFVPGQTQVFFGESRLIPAQVTGVTPTEVTVMVPAAKAGNVSGYFTVRVNGVEVTTQNLPEQAANPGNPAAVFPEFVVWGDANRDGRFGTHDVTLTRAFLLLQAAPTARQLLAVDVASANASGGRGNGQLGRPILPSCGPCLLARQVGESRVPGWGSFTPAPVFSVFRLKEGGVEPFIKEVQPDRRSHPDKTG